MRTIWVLIIILLLITPAYAVIYDWSGGVPVQTDNINFEWSGGVPYIIYEHSAGPEDTCSCPASGDWSITCSDNCSLTSCDMQTNSVYISGSGGHVSNIGNIYNAGLIRIEGGCRGSA